MRWLLPTLTLLLLGSCPAQRDAQDSATETQSQQPLSTADSGQADGTDAAGVYSPAALEYVEQCLAQPTEPGYPPLEHGWLAIAQLEGLSPAPEAVSLRGAVRSMVELAGERPPPQLVAAWLACEPAAASEFVRTTLAAGQPGYIDALSFAPASGRKLLAGLELAALDAPQARSVVRLLARWPRDAAADPPLLSQLAQHEDGTVRLQAIGLLIALGRAEEGQRRELWAAVREGGELLPAAAEGIRLSGDGALAEALVPLAAGAPLGDIDAEAPKQREALYASYALSYLPGEQAQLLRRKLLGAVDPTVRWQARLGELLSGEPSWWDDAVLEAGISDAEIWLALDPLEAWDTLLLPTLEAAARHDDPRLRMQAATQLNRYAALASDSRVTGLITQLIADDKAGVRAAAWFAAGTLGAGQLDEQAATVLADSAADGKVRIGAAFYLLRLAEEAGGGR